MVWGGMCSEKKLVARRSMLNCMVQRDVGLSLKSTPLTHSCGLLSRGVRVVGNYIHAQPAPSPPNFAAHLRPGGRVRYKSRYVGMIGDHAHTPSTQLHSRTLGRRVSVFIDT